MKRWLYPLLAAASLLLSGCASVIAKPFETHVEAVNCHHNYVEREHHFGADVWVTRKGAVRAGDGELGIIPGSTELFDKNDAPGHMLWVTLPNGKVLKTYYAGGPFLHVNETELASLGGRVTARYADGSVAGVFVPFGKGKVSVVGFHPEAGWWWKIFRGIFDFRGESWLVREMIRSVTPSN